ncbi:hypothetical protein D3C71_1736760 [compost metagenome]
MRGLVEVSELLWGAGLLEPLASGGITSDIQKVRHVLLALIADLGEVPTIQCGKLGFTQRTLPLVVGQRGLQIVALVGPQKVSGELSSGIDGLGRVEEVFVCNEPVGPPSCLGELTQTARPCRAHRLRVERRLIEDLLMQVVVAHTVRCSSVTNH